MPETDTWLGIYNERRTIYVTQEDDRFQADRRQPAGIKTGNTCQPTCIELVYGNDTVRLVQSLSQPSGVGPSRAAGIASHDSVGLGKSGKTLAYTRKGMMYSAVRA
ncbi:uncharacterized protein BO96DRAFT_337901 [Aspergillus niger CBS 101883]|uniref:Uncharacterized protein n=2 Tax=Aspergillus niger TaxID=5061 RepID=A2RBI0_ASPNC|nr:uncharacterized protein BO96DRAFT_337901 [Aspergillus niger CBS 101883]XP_059603011.1 hypothetical protein An18g06790 [Aspergillus niger]PYH56421.1 hypothetical protein BO96DRAFT_337901 [Aspergillus niger CBS 101883]CAK43386.1 hypothetical protein An18g06790 [Aspergillus niger]